MLSSSDRSISLWCIPQISGRPISSLECFISRWKLFSMENIKIFMKPSIYLKGREGNGKEVCDLWSCAWSFSWITRKELPDGSVMLQLGNEIIPTWWIFLVQVWNIFPRKHLLHQTCQNSELFGFQQLVIRLLMTASRLQLHRHQDFHLGNIWSWKYFSQIEDWILGINNLIWNISCSLAKVTHL